MKRKCAVCHLKTEKWQRINGSAWYCFDGCHSTTGIDRRTTDGKPAWLPFGRKKAWAESRLLKDQPR